MKAHDEQAGEHAYRDGQEEESLCATDTWRTPGQGQDREPFHGPTSSADCTRASTWSIARPVGVVP